MVTATDEQDMQLKSAPLACLLLALFRGACLGVKSTVQVVLNLCMWASSGHGCLRYIYQHLPLAGLPFIRSGGRSGN